MRTKTLGLVLLSTVACMSCAASVAGSAPDARDVTRVESSAEAGAFDVIAIDDGDEGDDRDGPEVFDAGVPSLDSSSERDESPDEVLNRDDGRTALDTRDDEGDAASSSDVATDAPPGDAERECEDFTASAVCPLRYETGANDPGARFSCCNGRCVSGGGCAVTPGLGRCTLGAQDPRGCNIAIGELCCLQDRGAVRCVQRDQGRCRRYN